MSVTVRIPASMQRLTEAQSRVEVTEGSVREVLSSLEGSFPGLGGAIFDDAGNLRRFLNIFVNEDDIRNLSGVETSVKNGDEIYIVPAIAGG